MKNKIKMIVEVTFPSHEEERDGETIVTPVSVHKFSYEWKSKYYNEDTPENREFIIKTIRADRDHDIEMRIKQLEYMHFLSTGSKNTEHTIEYKVDFDA